MIDPGEVIATKRDGREIDPGDLERFVAGIGKGEIDEARAAAFLMAAYLRGLSPAETHALTRGIVASGTSIALEGIGRPTIDKHSTGGVADTVTLILGPLVASLGLGLVKISGRGLGHTGGTVDKLEAIPGFRTALDPADIVRQLRDTGCAIAAQSADLVPADGVLYELRHRTGTVDSVPLIASSVMSKKLALGTDLILLDVKSGNGAFMRDEDAAWELARSCADVAGRFDRRVRIAVTDMSQPLGRAVGSALEVREAIDVLRGETRGRLSELTVTLAVEALVRLTGAGPEDARRRVQEALDSGHALEAFARFVEGQGGDPRVVDDPDVLPSAPVTMPVHAKERGFVASIDAAEIGRTAVELAGTPRTPGGADPGVGLVLLPKIGDRVEAGQPIGAVHARTPHAAEAAGERIRGAIGVTPEPIEPPPLVHGWLDG